MKADGFSLDDKRSEIAENDIPDIIERFHHLDKEADRERTEQSLFVPKQEIADNDYDLFINKYKKVEYVPVEYSDRGNHGRPACAGKRDHRRAGRVGGDGVMAKLGRMFVEKDRHHQGKHARETLIILIYRLITQTGYCVLRCLPNADKKYVFYFCQSNTFIKKLDNV